MRATGGGEHRWGRLWPWPSPASPPAFPRYSEGTNRQAGGVPYRRGRVQVSLGPSRNRREVAPLALARGGVGGARPGLPGPLWGAGVRAGGTERVGGRAEGTTHP